MTVPLIYTDKTSGFQEFIDKDSPVSIHMKSIQSLATEMHKEANNISPEIMKEVFNFCGEIGFDLKQQNISENHYLTQYIMAPTEFLS